MAELNRELCQKLKEAGFPQRIKEGDWFWTRQGHLYLWPHRDVECRGDLDEVKCPSTDELIEAVKEIVEAGLSMLWFVNKWSVQGGAAEGKDDIAEAPDLDTALSNLYLKIKESK